MLEEVVVDQPPAYIPPKPKFPILPALIGFFIVVILAALMGVVYFKTMFKPSPSVSPSPTPSPSTLVSPSPSTTSTPSASVKATVKPSIKPTIKSSTTPTPSPVVIPTLDIRFGNPSANVKQTYDDGSGTGRVINREYTSIQAGEFDEVISSWSPRVTVCYHIVSNEEVKGKDVKFVLTLDDKTDVEDNLGQYDKLEAGRLYDWCHDVTNDIGKHKARLTLNGDKSIKEIIYTNNVASLAWENLPDKIAPNFTLGGPYDWTTRGTCFLIISPSDNITPLTNLKIEQKSDNNSYASTNLGEYCFMGTSGTPHSYSVKVTDTRGNVNEQTRSFVLY